MTQRSTRRGGSTIAVVSVVVFLIGAGVTAVAFRGGGSGPNDPGSRDEHIVERGTFEISVPASGSNAPR